jgi:hypothetical protein
MELANCDISISRFEHLSNKKVVIVNEKEGKPEMV